ncbi:MAG: LysM peptidoglycan-binding domain-containing protein [Spirochaetaceae bacterium]|jgi:hypothetical protein|nr:LysM peptidoglycan-binding domain-containing protein [Spirochaetaceae bacterium]
MSSMIGIKVADGAFFPILADDVASKKRLVLTTVHDEQTSVQLDFYKASAASLRDAAYIGTLTLENISKKKKGDPSIEVIVSVNGEGEFFASAYDIDNPVDSGNHVLTASLTEHDAEFLEGIDFNENDISIDKENALDSEYTADKKKPRFAISLRIPVMIGIGVLALLLTLFFLQVFVFKNLSVPGEQKEVVEAEQSLPPPPPEPEPEPEPVSEPPELVSETPLPELASEPQPPAETAESAPQVIEAPPAPVTQQPASRRERPPAPVSSYKVPSVIPVGGVAYRIRWGDTLWDISQAFYRTPWRYSFLARYNDIRNPDRIVAGRTIRIPPLPK